MMNTIIDKSIFQVEHVLEYSGAVADGGHARSALSFSKTQNTFFGTHTLEKVPSKRHPVRSHPFIHDLVHDIMLGAKKKEKKRIL